ncbi:hypothetical protein BJ741DRAFT_582457 [Chytriomyces cf. hyalinus JEL632]|nr:hypothetical protein BJ741DRAFT_582457 [Chytriomyces cf. hyalinus JEL632]
MTIDKDISDILAKQEILLKLQTEQVAEILKAVQTQIDLNLELRELLSELAGAGEQVQSSTIQAIEQMDSSITLASQDIAAILMQATSATDSVGANCETPAGSPTAVAVPEPEITVVTSVTAPPSAVPIPAPKTTDLPVNRTRTPSELAYISLFPELVEMMRWSEQPHDVRQAALDAKVAAGPPKLALDANVAVMQAPITAEKATASQAKIAPKKRKNGIEKFREWRANASALFNGFLHKRFCRTRG